MPTSAPHRHIANTAFLAAATRLVGTVVSTEHAAELSNREEEVQQLQQQLQAQRATAQDCTSRAKSNSF